VLPDISNLPRPGLIFFPMIIPVRAVRSRNT